MRFQDGGSSVCRVAAHRALYVRTDTFFGSGPSPVPDPGVVGLRKGPNWEGKHSRPTLVVGDPKEISRLDFIFGLSFSFKLSRENEFHHFFLNVCKNHK
jgi:hypothetical protein